MTAAREIAYEITRRVNSGGGYLGLLLRYGMEKSGLDPRERSLVTELTYGVQRHRNRLDYIIDAFSSRSPSKLDPEVLDVLRLGVFQLTETRIPQHAAVNETVALARSRLGAGAASYVNAVLRRSCRDLAALSWPPRAELPSYLETVLSHPGWLVEYLIGLLGPHEAEALCIADNRPPDLTLRANPERIDAASLQREIERAGGEASRSPHIDVALRGVRIHHSELVALIERGLCAVQDEGSMLVVHAVEPAAGETIVDACAAPGGKALYLAQLCGGGCRVVAVDRNQKRLGALRKAAAAAGVRNFDIRPGDATRLAQSLDGMADAVLVDAPCSGLGTLQRNPELKWRRNLDDAIRMASLQSALLEGCAEVVRPGGRMIYSVCTYTLEETVEVVRGFLDTRDDFRLESLSRHVQAPLSDAVAPEGFAQLWPHLHQTEGMFIARMLRD